MAGCKAHAAGTPDGAAATDAWVEVVAAPDMSAEDGTAVPLPDGTADAGPWVKPCQSNSDCPVSEVACAEWLCTVATGGCHLVQALDGAPCDDGQACSALDTCLAGLCAPGANACGCEQDADCASHMVGNLCNGGWFCNKAVSPSLCQPDLAKKVTCLPAETPCQWNLCNPVSGACEITAVNDGGGCEDGLICTTGDHCEAGACAAGPDLCACQNNSDCADNDNACDGAPYCNKSVMPWQCATNPATVVTCPAQGDTACSANQCDVKSGQCQMKASNDMGACSDGNPCTSGDTCQAGACQPGTDVCGCKADGDCATSEDGDLCNGTLYCNLLAIPHQCVVNPASTVTCPHQDDTACHKNLCNPKTGKCAQEAVADQSPCSDDNPCTPGDHCLGGQCATGANICPCQGSGDCATKDDGNLCNGLLFCDKSELPYVCKFNPATVVVCSQTSDSLCLSSVCQPTTGQCATVAAKDGAACDADGTACTAGDACQGGACSVGVAVCDCQTSKDCAKFEDGDACNGSLYCDTAAHQCKVAPATVVLCPSAPDTACLANACQPVSGKCLMQPRNQGLLCDDANPCTSGDTCQGGACAPGPDTCACKKDLDCTALEDGDLCNGTLYCDKSAQPWHCQVNPATMSECPTGPLGPCSVSGCNAKTGKCQAIAVADNAACDDGQVCTVGDTCKAGSCSPGASLCACGSDQDCLAKEDGNACNGTLFCDKSNVPFVCNVNPATVVQCGNAGQSACVQNQCQPSTGNCAMANVKDGTPCLDGNACTALDACVTGMCVGSKLLCDDKNACTLDFCSPALGCQTLPAGDCPDGNPCTLDACDAKQGCAHPPIAAVCSDDSDCTTDDACQGGSCTGKTIGCDDGNACTYDACLAQGGCIHANNATACDDGNACTVTDTCAGGACAGQASSCDDGQPCTKDACSANGGCSHTQVTGQPCNDGDACTANDFCLSKCQGSPIFCNDFNPCTNDTCTKVDGCQFAPIGNSCTDGNQCTENDLCSGGACKGQPKTCIDSNVCTADTCDPKKGCVYLPQAATCTDQNGCTIEDMCDANGYCKGTPKSCDDANPCTSDFCNGGNCYHSTQNGAACDDGLGCTKDVCDYNAKCISTAMVCNFGAACDESSAKCKCLPYYTGDGATCVPVLENECAKGKDTCQAPAVCADLTAGFLCVCPEGSADLGGGKCAAPAGLGETLTAPGAKVLLNEDGKFYVGGSFAHVGPRTGSWARTDPTTGSVQEAVAQVAGAVAAAISDGKGGWYLGGTIHHVGGIPRSGVVHLGSDGSLDASFVCTVHIAETGFFQAPHAGVETLALNGNTLYLGGGFDQVNGTGRTYGAAVNATTGQVLAWAPNPSTDVNAITVHGDRVWLAGNFTSVGGAARKYVATVDPVTGTAVGVDLQFNKRVWAFAQVGGDMLLGGEFSMVQGQARSGIARIDSAGQVTAFTIAGGSGNVHSLLVNGGTAYLGTPGFLIDGVVKSGVLAIDLASQTGVAGFDPKFTATSSVSVRCMALLGGTLYVGGTLGSFGGVARPHAAALDATTGALQPWQAQPGGTVRGLTVGSGSVWLGGAFVSAPALPRQALAIVDASTGTLVATPAFFASPNATVRSLARSGNLLFVGGSFSEVLGITVQNLAAIDLGTFKLAYTSGGQNTTVMGLATWNGKVISMNSGYYPALVQIDPSNGSSVAYLGGFQGQSSSTQLAALQVAGNLALVGGDFVSVAGSPRIGVAAIELTSHKLAPWNANLGTNSKVFAIAVAGNYVYLGGEFTLAGGATVKNVARVALSNGAVDAALSFKMSSGVVGAMAADATRLFLGGSFVTVGGVAVQGLAAVNLGDLSTTAFKPNLRHAWSEYDNSGWQAVRQMSLQNGQLHILGDFEAVDGLPQSGWATLTGP